ncbi:uncharacterized protein EV420DRAFT_1474776 [Desarmillaria tabescens]|uniref:Uncharacterized protein n=1 Tax=Armillaria tabescens TaxID=1929756 RepID=A0AA39TPE0_ARMTA|nr:uncharacterized protein EV420DRAFT_1474776 [Desarmillaria tabescens]KAK0465957.1 hypothetical protein EV420DRAFT_1474776 [Desarmillaria tabescens]
MALIRVAVIHDAVSWRNSRTCIVTSPSITLLKDVDVDGLIDALLIYNLGQYSHHGYEAEVAKRQSAIPDYPGSRNKYPGLWSPFRTWDREGWRRYMIRAYDHRRAHGFLDRYYELTNTVRRIPEIATNQKFVNSRNRFHASLVRRESKLRIQHTMCKVTFETMSRTPFTGKFSSRNSQAGKAHCSPPSVEQRLWYYLDCYGTVVTQLPLMKAMFQEKKSYPDLRLRPNVDYITILENSGGYQNIDLGLEGKHRGFGTVSRIGASQ